MKDLELESPAVQPDLPKHEMTQGNLFTHLKQEQKPVTCLGLTFPNDEARRAHFTALLAEKLKDPTFRAIEGFPIGKDEDILALSDPPYYCACPNPWLGDFIKEWEAAKPKWKGRYEREPFAADVSEGKNDPIYNAHSYHTKVPHKAIMRYILHYTEPGDIVFDGFCGTGMTGVAAQMCGDKKTVESLGYKVDDKGNITDPRAEDPKKVFSHLGARKAVLNDLSPVATFIAYNYNTPVDVVAFEQEAKCILAEVEKECGWMYETQHVDKDGKPICDVNGKPILGKVNCTIWSDVYLCPHCKNEFIYWNVAMDSENAQIRDVFNCPTCHASLSKKDVEGAKEMVFDEFLGKVVNLPRRQPVLISYSFGGKSFTKKPSDYDLDVLMRINASKCPYEVPKDRMMHAPEDQEKWGNRWRANTASFAYVHHLYTKRNLWVLAAFNSRIASHGMRFLLTGMASRASMMNRLHVNHYFFGGGGWNGGYLKGAIYIPSLPIETSVLAQWRDRLDSVRNAYKNLRREYQITIPTESSTNRVLSSEVLDYIFMDPPFGANLDYSELNFLWESWLKVWTNNSDEAIESPFQGKGSIEYRRLMAECFQRAYESLKPGRWITVEFSNTSASVWNGIQSALSNVGFIVANVSALDKKQGSFNAVTNATSVKQDLVISAYKPDAEFERRFKDEAATEDGVWDFIRTHLEKLPVSKMKMLGGMAQLQVVPERDPRILFDKVVAYYFRNGFPIPISAKEFQEGLRARFTEDDGMFFLPEQHAEYLKQKAKATKLVQAELFVSDESSAIAWLRQKLKEKPQKIQTIQPEFMQQIQAWNRYEQQLELRVLLEQNFLCYDGRGPVPNPIHTYLSTQYHELRNLKDEDPTLKAKAKDLWYVPNPKDAAEVERMRERALLREYETYKTARKVKTPRLEALRLGFQKSYEEHDYAMIVAIAKKLPADVVETDEKLLRYFDRAQLHLED